MSNPPVPPASSPATDTAACWPGRAIGARYESPHHKRRLAVLPEDTARLAAAGRTAGVPRLAANGTGRISAVRVRIDPGRCQGHGRCYDLSPGLFGDDEEGYGRVRGDGIVPPGQEHGARLAALNCPEHAIGLLEGA